MIKLLIVDDEPYIVDGLFEMLSESTALDVELYTAYSADEAIQRLLTTKMDIIISDIRMPGMNGLELQRWISERWPKCKVIFLTGFGDIHYAQEAIRFGCSDYILKTEGDESILRSINNAIAQINAEAINDQVMLNAQKQFLQALPVLHKQWFMEILDPKRTLKNVNEKKFQELNIQLSINEKVLLLAGRVDNWNQHEDFSTQLQLMYGVQSIVEENLNAVRILSIVMEGSEIIWLIQPKKSHTILNSLSLSTIKPWEDTLSYVTGSMESIQTSCRFLLELPISLVCTGNPVNWKEIALAYGQIKQTMLLGVGNGEEMLITKCDVEKNSHDLEVYRHPLSQFEQYLETNDIEECKSIVIDLFQKLPNHYGIFAEVYYKITSLLLVHFNKLHHDDHGLSIDRLINIAAHQSKSETIQVLCDILEKLSLKRKGILDERTHRVIKKLNKHIPENLSKDLSLDTLANLVYMNPSYLSTLYKQYTGKNISDYITELRVEKAKDLLQHTSFKIHEIAEEVGFSTSGYFTRFFKKHVGMTPQEYRN
jgi:two-component system, response regulator YesN